MNLIYPVLAQIVWTFVTLALMARARFAAVRAREVRRSDIALSPDAWPAQARAAGNNFSNQFETPVLFYALAGVAVFVGATGWLMTALAWFYVASRVVHTLVHVGQNDMRLRPKVFAVGVAALFCMLLVILATLL